MTGKTRSRINMSGQDCLSILSSFRDVHEIQQFLDDIQYNHVCNYLSPIGVLEKGEANCVDGAIFAAAALKLSLGRQPLLLDLVSCTNPHEDHVIAIIKEEQKNKTNSFLYGSLAKSQTTTLRGRDSIYKSVRELVMSYFPFYVDIGGRKILRKYSEPLNLDNLCKDEEWIFDDRIASKIEKRLYTLKHFNILEKGAARKLQRAEPVLVRAVYLGTKPKDIYRPGKWHD